MWEEQTWSSQSTTGTPFGKVHEDMSDSHSDNEWSKVNPFADALSENEWQSKSHSSTVLQAHRALYERVEASVEFGFAALQRALVELQLHTQLKARQWMEQQEIILQTQSPSPDAITQFEENVAKIDRTLESFAAHAANLSQIKLTLARAAAFVSPEGNLAQLVTKAQPKRPTMWPPMFPNEGPAPQMGFGPLILAPQGTVVCTDPDNSRYVPMRVSDDHSRGGQRPGTQRSKDLSLGNLPTQQNLGRQGSMSNAGKVFRGHRPSMSECSLDRLSVSSTSSSANRIPNATCFVFYLPPSATNDTLRQLFMRYGTVLNAYVAMDKATNRTRGFGFVDFLTPAEAQAAVVGLDKFPLEGKFLSVSIKV